MAVVSALEDLARDLLREDADAMREVRESRGRNTIVGYILSAGASVPRQEAEEAVRRALARIDAAHFGGGERPT